MSQTSVETSRPAAPPAPVDPFARFRQEMDRLMDRFMPDFGPRLRGLAPAMPWMGDANGMVMPAMDVTEGETAFVLTAELPGLAEADIDVSVSGGMLRVKGEKRQESEQTRNDVHVRERAFGRFERSFTLPDGVDAEKIAASFGKGVLTVTMPKTPGGAAATRKVAITPAG